MSIQLTTTNYLQEVLANIITNNKLSHVIGNKIVRVRPNYFIFKTLIANKSLCNRCGTVYVPNVTFDKTHTTDIKTLEKLKRHYPKKKISSSVAIYICKTCKFKFYDVYQSVTAPQANTDANNKKIRLF